MIFEPQENWSEGFKDSIDDVHLLCFPKPVEYRLHNVVVFTFRKRWNLWNSLGSPCVIHASVESHHHIQSTFTGKFYGIHQFVEVIELDLVKHDRVLLKKRLNPVFEVGFVTLVS